MKILVHAGMPKTATTALQAFLAANDIALREQGVLYPRSGRYSETFFTHHACFLSFLTHQPRHFVRPFTPTNPPEEYVLALRAEIEFFRPHTVILSSEHLFSPDFTLKKLVEIRRHLDFADEVNALLLLRQPSEILPSLYAQHVAGLHRATRSPANYLKMQEEFGTFHYEKRLRTFDAAFGVEHVWVRDYGEVRTDIVEPLRELANVVPGGDWRRPEEQNQRLSWPIIHLMRLANMLPAAGGPARAALRTLDGWLPRGDWRRRLEAPFRPYSTDTLRRLDRDYPSARTVAQRQRVAGV